MVLSNHFTLFVNIKKERHRIIYESHLCGQQTLKIACTNCIYENKVSVKLFEQIHNTCRIMEGYLKECNWWASPKGGGHATKVATNRALGRDVKALKQESTRCRIEGDEQVDSNEPHDRLQKLARVLPCGFLKHLQLLVCVISRYDVATTLYPWHLCKTI